MRVIKPLQPALLYKTFTFHKKHQLSIGILIGFHFDKKEAIIEPELWKFIGEELGRGNFLDGQGMLDMGMPKVNGELILYGSYFAPQGKPVGSGHVRVSLGTLDKELRVFGNRHWQKVIGPSIPEPMVEMPISYENAFGGKNYKKNPLGKGFQTIETETKETYLPLPNIEDPEHIITSPDDRPEPVGFAPLDMMWPQRADKIGTHDETWLREHSPGYAMDIDWTHFNTTPTDQWIKEYFKGDESFIIENMHPEKSLLKGTLPGLYGRAFMIRNQQDEKIFSEIKTRLDTVWLFPRHEMGVVLWRGAARISEDDGADVEELLIAYEALNDDPRPADHYENIMHRCYDPSERLKLFINTEDLIPYGTRCAIQQIVEDADTFEGHLAQNAKAQAEKQKKVVEEKLEQKKNDMIEKLKALGVDPGPFLKKIEQQQKKQESDPGIKRINELIEEAVPGATKEGGKVDIQKIDFQKLKALPTHTKEIENAAKEVANDRIKKAVENIKNLPGTEEITKKLEERLKQMDGPPPLPRPPGKEVITKVIEQKEKMEKARETLINMSIDREKIPKITFDVDLHDLEKKIEEGAKGFRTGYIIGAAFLDKGIPPHAGKEKLIAERMLDKHRDGESLANGDYAAVDLSGQNLSGIDLSGAFLEDVNFSKAKLTGANLSNAILARANLIEADLTWTNLTGACLGGAILQNADLSHSDLGMAILSKADFTGAKLIKCNLLQTQLLETCFVDTDFQESDLTGLLFLELLMNGSRFHKADLTSTIFIKSKLNNTDFSQAKGFESVWVETEANHANFENTHFENIRLVAGCSLKDANFRNARLDRANLGEADLEGADFSFSTLEMAYLGKAILKNTCFYKAVAPRAVFMKTDLSDAKMNCMNMAEGSFLKARLVGTNLSDSNLYGTEFMYATLGDTDFSNTNLDRTLLKDWRPS